LIRLLVFIILLSLVVFASGCDDDSGDDTDDDTDDDDDDDTDDDTGPTRSFFLASAPFRFEVTDASISSVFDFTGFAGQMDIVSIHTDNFFGLPWDEFAADISPPGAWLDVMERIRADAEASGLDVYLSVTPLSGLRATLAAKALDVGGELVVDDGWITGCYNFDTGPEHEAIRTAYLRYVRWMVDFFEPVYLTHGIEVNMYDISCPNDYQSLIGLLNDVYDQEKGVDPNLPIFPTFTAADMWYESETRDCWPHDRSCLVENLAKVADLRRDRLGVSSYPIWEFQEMGSWPDDYFTAFAEETGERVVFGETGWNNHDVTVPWPELGDPCQTVATSSDALQIQYMEYLFEKAEQMDSDLVVWWSYRDYLFEQMLTSCPCDAPGLWCVLYEAIADVGLLAPWMMWGSMGVVDYDGNEKAVKGTWDSWLARELRDGRGR